MITKARAAEWELMHLKFDRQLREGIEATKDLPSHGLATESYACFVLRNKLEADRKFWEDGEAPKILGRVKHE